MKTLRRLVREPIEEVAQKCQTSFVDLMDVSHVRLADVTRFDLNWLVSYFPAWGIHPIAEGWLVDDDRTGRIKLP